jgi:hypothetical protein
MAATAEQVIRLRRMVAEPTTSPYTDAILEETLERYPLLDSEGLDSDNDDWVATYDLHAAAADIWEEKAGSFVTSFNFTADGTNFQLSQKYEQMMARVLYHRSRRSPKTGTMIVWPKEGVAATMPWIGNLPEEDL